MTQENPPVTVLRFNCTCGISICFESVDGVISQKRTWVGLTDDEFNEIYDRYVPTSCYALLMEKVEEKLKEKND